MTSPKNLAPAQAKTSSPKPNGQPSPGSIGNTPGLIIPQPSPNGGIEAGKPTALTDPPAKTETPAEKGLIDKALDLYEKGNIGFLEKLQKAGLDKIDVMVESSGYSMPAMVAGAIGKAALEVFMPTNVVDLVPGGKGANLTKKGADATGALKKGKKATEATEVAKDTGKADNAKPVAKEDGVYSKGSRSQKTGKCGEKLAKQDMREAGFDEIVEVQNKSGHGVDLIGRNSQTGEVKVWEVKATEGTRAPPLSEAQDEMGGKKFAEDRLERAANGKGNYGKVPEAMANAKKARKWLEETGGKVTYEKREVFVDDMDKGCAKHPNRPSRSKPWEAKK